MDKVPGSRYTSARGAAMGDAFLPLGDDGASALFYNPAGVGKIGRRGAEPFNIQFYGNSGYFGLFSLRSPTFYRVAGLSGYLPTLQANPGVWSGVGAGVLPAFYMRGVAAGLLLQSKVGAQVNADGTVRYRSLYQLIPSVAVGARLAGGIVRLGYGLQWVQQASGVRDDVAATSDPLGYNEGIAQGSAFSHNVGFALTLPYRYLPSVNVVARNVLTARYRSSTLIGLARNASGTPADEPMSIDASFSVQPKSGSGSHFNVVLEGRDLTGTSGMPLLGRLALGLEFSLRDRFFLRGGWGSGYPNAGIGLARKGGEFSFAWYSEEIGEGYHQIRDTRYLMQYQVRTF